MPLMLNGKEVVSKLNKDLKAVYLGNKLIYKSSTQVLLSGISSNAILVSKDGLNYQRKTVTTPSGNNTTMFSSFGTVNGKIWAANTNGIYITEDLVNYTLLIGNPSSKYSLSYGNLVANIGSQFAAVFENLDNAILYFCYTNQQGTAWATTPIKLDTSSNLICYKLTAFKNEFLLFTNAGVYHININSTERTDDSAYASMLKKCYFTETNGDSFESLTKYNSSTVMNFTCANVVGNEVYCCLNYTSNNTQSIFKSVDGINWTGLYRQESSINRNFGFLSLAINDNAIVCLYKQDSSYLKFIRSLDYGQTWQSLGRYGASGPSGSWVNTCFLQYFNDILIYNGVKLSGVQNIWYSTDNAASLNKASSGGGWGTPGSFVCLETELNI